MVVVFGFQKLKNAHWHRFFWGRCAWGHFRLCHDMIRKNEFGFQAWLSANMIKVLWIHKNLPSEQKIWNKLEYFWNKKINHLGCKICWARLGQKTQSFGELKQDVWSEGGNLASCGWGRSPRTRGARRKQLPAQFWLRVGTHGHGRGVLAVVTGAQHLSYLFLCFWGAFLGVDIVYIT